MSHSFGGWQCFACNTYPITVLNKRTRQTRLAFCMVTRMPVSRGVPY
jgi:hypothetical protein